MFKNRTYVSGIGLGLIVGAIILQLMLAVKDTGARPPVLGPSGSAALDELNQKQLKDEASKYYQVFDKTEKVYTQADFEQKLEDELKARSAQSEGKKVAVYITQGLVASQVAELLYQAGVVADRNEFEKLLNEQQIAGKIQAGYHSFVGSPKPQQVIDSLVSKQ